MNVPDNRDGEADNKNAYSPGRAVGISCDGVKKESASEMLVLRRRLAESVAAVLALVVIEYVGVDGFANGCASSTTGGASEKGTHEGTSQATEDRTDGACDHAEGCTGFSSA